MHERPSPSIDPDAETSAGAVIGPAPASRPHRIGDYTIINVIGEGGMGVVYLAEQANPRRTVALKVIRPGAATPRMLRRFEHEAMVLGRLQHAGIAQIYEAGTADTGAGPQPFYAMELVRGRPLTEYVQIRRLPVRERLGLFAQICDAVQHAHTKGIIHRDLKPANILVDDLGRPRILDFGVARLADLDGGATTQHTDIGQLIGTLPYMSPEQVGGDPTDLDTRSDVYALGVVLYELLAERAPYAVSRTSIPEAINIIRTQEPTRLSSISKVFRGDIETIVTKALEKDKARRYQSAGDLGADIERYLRDEPIVAHPPTALYQLRKFAARHKAVVAGACLAAIALSAATVITSRQASIATGERDRAIAAEKLAEDRLAVAERAQRAEAEARQAAQTEAETARAVNKFLTDMLSAVDPDNARGQRVEVADVLDAAASLVRHSFQDRPLVEAAIRHTIGSTYIGLGDEQAAEPHIIQSLDTRTRLLPPDHPDTIDSLGLLATLRDMQGRAEQAEAHHRDIIQRCRRAFGESHRTTLVALGNYAIFLADEDRPQDADAILGPALESARQTLGEEDPETQRLLFYSGRILDDRGRHAEAEAIYREVYEWRRRVLGDDHPDTIVAMHTIGLALKAQNKLDEAEQFYRESISGMERVFGPRSPVLLTVRDNLAGLLYAQQKTAESIAAFEEVVAARRERLGDEHPRTLASMNNLAAILLQAGDLDRAEPIFRQVLEIQLRVLGADHPNTIGTRHNLASLLRDRGNNAEAEPIFREVIADRRRTQGIEHPDSLRALHALGVLYLEQKNYERAEPVWTEQVEVCRRALGDAHVITVSSLAYQARLYRETGRCELAEPIYREVIELAPRVYGDAAARVAGYHGSLGLCLSALGRNDEAEHMLLSSHEAFKAALGPDHAHTKTAAERLVEFYIGMGRPEAAAPYRTDPSSGAP